MAVVSDRKEGVAEGFNPYQTTHYRSIVQSAQDYYAFGQEMPERSYNSKGYRYGFNGKEKDESGEIGNLTTYDYGFRIYNPGIGRFLSVDPLTSSYPWYTPYQFAGNNPIWAMDLDGLEEDIIVDEVGKKSKPVIGNVPPLPIGIPNQAKKQATRKAAGKTIGKQLLKRVPYVGGGVIVLDLIVDSKVENPCPTCPQVLPDPFAASQDNTRVSYFPILIPESYFGEASRRSEEEEGGTILYRTYRSRKFGKQLPYYGITSADEPVGAGGRYSPNDEEAQQLEIIARGTRSEMLGAETAIILLNSNGDPANVPTITRIDNLKISTSDPMIIESGKQILNQQDPGWQVIRLEPEQDITPEQ